MDRTPLRNVMHRRRMTFLSGVLPKFELCRALSSYFGSGDECANDANHAKHEEQRGMLVVCDGGRIGQRMIDAGDKVVHTEQDADHCDCDCSVEQSWIL